MTIIKYTIQIGYKKSSSLYKILIIGSSPSRKTNALLNVVYHSDFDQMYL